MNTTSAPQLLRRLYAHLRPFRLPLVLVVVVDLLAIPITLLTPLPLAIAVDHAVTGAPLPSWAIAWLPSTLTASKAGPILCQFRLPDALKWEICKGISASRAREITSPMDSRRKLPPLRMWTVKNPPILPVILKTLTHSFRPENVQGR